MMLNTQRLAQIRTPGWHHTQLVRRLLAAALITAALVIALGNTITSDPKVVIVTRPVAAGHIVQSDDLTLKNVPTNLVPAGSFHSVNDVVGRVAVAALQPNEIPSNLRFVSPELTAHLVNLDTVETNQEHDSLEQHLGPPTLVPIKLADPSLANLLNHGDTVTVVTQSEHDPEPVTVAAGGRVVLSSTQQNGVGFAANSPAEAGTILVALPEAPAKRVAAASLTSPLAVVLTGKRANPAAAE